MLSRLATVDARVVRGSIMLAKPTVHCAISDVFQSAERERTGWIASLPPPLVMGAAPSAATAPDDLLAVGDRTDRIRSASLDLRRPSIAGCDETAQVPIAESAALVLPAAALDGTDAASFAPDD